MGSRYIELDEESAARVLHNSKHGSTATFRQRCRLIHLSHQGYDIATLAELESLTRQSVAKWFNRYEADGIDGLRTRRGQGRPPIVRMDNRKVVDKIEQLVDKYPQKLDVALEKIEEYTGKPMSRKTLKRILKKTAGLGNASAVSQPSGPQKPK